MAIILPEYIGHPQSQINEVSGGDREFFSNHMKQKFIYAKITPKLPQINMDANIYDGKDAWGDWKKDLMDACGADTGKNNGHIKVVLSKLTPITENFSNDYGSSEILPTGGLMGQKMQELMYLTGATDTNELQKQLAGLGGLPGFVGDKALGAYNSAVDYTQKLALKLQESDSGLANLGGNALNAITTLAKSPWSKINWPQVWKNCSFQSSYNLQTRLYCYNCATSTDYDSNIRASLTALQLFATPKSKDAILYVAPYIMDFEIPGVLHMPLAYCSSISVIKGGNEGDFAGDGRPNIIDVNMNIQNVYSIIVNAPQAASKKNKDRPSLYHDSTVLSKFKDENNSPSDSQSPSNTNSASPPGGSGRRRASPAIRTAADRLAGK